jgi:hypothetical protein
MSVADDRGKGGKDRNGRGATVVPINLAQRGRPGEPPETSVADADALEATSLIDRVTGGGTRVADPPSDRPEQVKRRPRFEHVGRREPPRNPYTIRSAHTAVPASANGRVSRSRSARVGASLLSWPYRPSRLWHLPSLSAIANRRSAAAAAFLLIAGVGVATVALLNRGGSARTHTPFPAAKAASTPTPASNPAQALFADKSQLAASRARLVAAKARAKARAVSRVRARARARHVARSKPRHTLPASTSYDTVLAAAPSSHARLAATPVATPSQPSAPIASSSPSSSGSSSSPSTGSSSTTSGGSVTHSASPTSSPAKQPALGATGTLAPGSSPDS